MVGIPFVGEQEKVIDLLISYISEPFQWTLTTLVCCRTMTVEGSSEEYTQAEGDIRELTEGIDYNIIDHDRSPTKAEKSICSPHIFELIQTIQPHGLILLGIEYKTKLPKLTISHPRKILDKEYKLLTVLKDSHKVSKFITGLYNENDIKTRI